MKRSSAMIRYPLISILAISVSTIPLRAESPHLVNAKKNWYEVFDYIRRFNLSSGQAYRPYSGSFAQLGLDPGLYHSFLYKVVSRRLDETGDVQSAELPYVLYDIDVRFLFQDFEDLLREITADQNQPLEVRLIAAEVLIRHALFLGREDEARQWLRFVVEHLPRKFDHHGKRRVGSGLGALSLAAWLEDPPVEVLEYLLEVEPPEPIEEGLVDSTHMFLKGLRLRMVLGLASEETRASEAMQKLRGLVENELPEDLEKSSSWLAVFTAASQTERPELRQKAIEIASKRIHQGFTRFDFPGFLWGYPKTTRALREKILEGLTDHKVPDPQLMKILEVMQTLDELPISVRRGLLEEAAKTNTIRSVLFASFVEQADRAGQWFRDDEEVDGN